MQPTGTVFVPDPDDKCVQSYAVFRSIAYDYLGVNRHFLASRAPKKLILDPSALSIIPASRNGEFLSSRQLSRLANRIIASIRLTRGGEETQGVTGLDSKLLGDIISGS